MKLKANILGEVPIVRREVFLSCGGRRPASGVATVKTFFLVNVHFSIEALTEMSPHDWTGLSMAIRCLTNRCKESHRSTYLFLDGGKFGFELLHRCLAGRNSSLVSKDYDTISFLN